MKKTADGRICEKRVVASKELLNSLLSDYKAVTKLTWKAIAEDFGISEYTFYDWRKKNQTIPLSLFNKLLQKLNLEIANLDVEIRNPFWGQNINRNSNQNIKFPKVNSLAFSEFYGIMLGDGCVYSNLKGFCISGNSILDKPYLEAYVSNLIEKLFNIKPHIYFSKKSKSIRCIVYSKLLAKFLVDYGFPKGKKKLGNLIIPEDFFRNPEMLKLCIRGINDTDGSVYPQNNSKIILDISICSKTLLYSTVAAFNKLEFIINFTNNRIYLCGVKPVSSFFEFIGSSNLRQLIKYNHFLNHDFVPSTIETERLLKQGKSA